MKSIRSLVALLLAAVGASAQLQPELRAELDTAFKKGIALRQQNNYKDAVPFFEKAAELAPKVFGPEHVNTGGILAALGEAYSQSGRLRAAEAPLRQSLTIREKALGKDHFDLFGVLNSLAINSQKLGNLKEAEILMRRRLALAEAKFGKSGPDLWLTWNNLAVILLERGKLPEAEELWRKSLRVLEELRGKDHPDVAHVLQQLATVSRSQQRLDDAETAAARALEICEAKLGKNHLRTAAALNELGLAYLARARFKDAEGLYRRALEIRETQLGKDHLETTTIMGNLAGALMDQGRFQEAEPLVRRALKIRENQLGPDHVRVAHALNQLALLLDQTGRSADTTSVYRRCLKIRETAQGPNHPDVGVAAYQLAAILASTGQYEQAEPLYLRSLRIAEAAWGPNHGAVADATNGLGILYQHLGRIAEAEAMLRRSQRSHENVFGKDHPTQAKMLHNLATFCIRQGRFSEAEDHFKNSLTLTRKFHGPKFGATATTLLGLAGVQQALNHPREAFQSQEECLQVYQFNLNNFLGFNSEAALEDYLQGISGVLPLTIHHARSLGTESAIRSSLTWMLRLKGIALDTACRYRRAQHLLTPDDPLTQRVAEYRSLKQNLANAALQPSKDAAGEAAQREKWRKQAEELEAELNREMTKRQPPSFLEGEAVTAQAVQRQLAPGSVLIEWTRMPLRDFKSAAWGEDRYFAFVLRAGDAPPELIDLGPAAPIHDGIEAVRTQFTDFQEKLRDCESADEIHALEKTHEKQFRQVSAALHARIIAPLKKAIGAADLWYVSADAELNRLPFESLVGEDGKYLAETSRIAYLSSGRDLLRSAMVPATGTVVFAGPDYKLDAAERLAIAEKLLKKKESVVASRGGTNLRSVGWKALPGAAAEARDVQVLLKDSRFSPVKTYQGAEALEEVLKALPAPRVLHLATHGFFLDHEPQVEIDDEALGAGGARARLRKVDNPLLRSGIVLAGANTVGDKDTPVAAEDGWVTAEEIALLNLTGTELVVLSACQTGLGDIKTGEGVYGLRRAFLYAGARTLVTSLFEVPDAETRELMKRFYSGLKAGEAKLSALNGAQRETIRERLASHGAAHPFFWASFVLVGDPK